MIETSLMVAFSQITEGEARCEECGEVAQMTLTAEPDYHDTPMCWTHGRLFVDLAVGMGDKFWRRA